MYLQTLEVVMIITPLYRRCDYLPFWVMPSDPGQEETA
jgi:hypothetical protein